MTVVFFDQDQSTYKRVENVIQFQNALIKGANGRPTKFWLCIKADGKDENFKQNRYTIERIEN